MGKAQFKPIHALMWNGGRQHERTTLQRRTTLRDEEGWARDVILEDLSLSGFKMESDERLIPGQLILIGLEGVGARSAKVMWSRDDQAGCRFTRPITQSEMDTTLTASVVIETNFAFSRAPVGQKAPDAPEQEGLSARRRLAIILVAGTVFWGIAIAIGLAIRALVLPLL